MTSAESSNRMADVRAGVRIEVFSMLCVYVVAIELYNLITRAKAESSVPGLIITAAAVLLMPYLGSVKRRIAGQIGSSALRGDAACSMTCAYMAGAVLIGLAANAFFG